MLEKLTTARIESAADLYDWDELVQEDRVHRLIYTDPAIFQAEMTNIFGAVWVYLGHESQIPKNDDYITVRLGLRPIILLRDSQGKFRALFRGQPSEGLLRRLLVGVWWKLGGHLVVTVGNFLIGVALLGWSLLISVDEILIPLSLLAATKQVLEKVESHDRAPSRCSETCS